MTRTARHVGQHNAKQPEDMSILELCESLGDLAEKIEADIQRNREEGLQIIRDIFTPPFGGSDR